MLGTLRFSPLARKPCSELVHAESPLSSLPSCDGGFCNFDSTYDIGLHTATTMASSITDTSFYAFEFVFTNECIG